MIILFGDIQLPVELARMHQAVRCTSWPDVLAKAKAAELIALHVPQLDEIAVKRLRQLRWTARATPVILQTSRDTSNLRQLARVMVDAVVWIDELPTALGAAMEIVAREQLVLEELIETVETAQHLSGALRAIMRTALYAEPPFATVKKWSVVCQRTPRAIEKLWKRQFGTVLGPHEFLATVRAARTPSAVNRELLVSSRAKLKDLSTMIRAGENGAEGDPL